MSPAAASTAMMPMVHAKEFERAVAASSVSRCGCSSPHTACSDGEAAATRGVPDGDGAMLAEELDVGVGLGEAEADADGASEGWGVPCNVGRVRGRCAVPPCLGPVGRFGAAALTLLFWFTGFFAGLPGFLLGLPGFLSGLVGFVVGLLGFGVGLVGPSPGVEGFSVGAGGSAGAYCGSTE